MPNNFRPPEYGEPVLLMCLKCHKSFVGPNPSGPKLLYSIFKNVKRAKCPECGSRRVIRNPFIQY